MCGSPREGCEKLSASLQDGKAPVDFHHGLLGREPFQHKPFINPVSERPYCSLKCYVEGYDL
jgi:hypothetical protein